MLLAAHGALLELHLLPVPLLSLYIFSVPLCFRSKISADNLMPWHFPVLSSSLLSCWCCVTVCSKGGCLFVGACCVLFVCYGLFPRGLCVHSSPKNRASLWQHGCRLTCDTLECFLSKYLSFFPISLSLFPSSSNIILTSVPPPGLTSPFFYNSHSYSLHHLCLCLAHDCSIKSTDTW